MVFLGQRLNMNTNLVLLDTDNSGFAMQSSDSSPYFPDLREA